METFLHETVLAHELVDGLNIKPGDFAIDCTAGGGGHTQLLLDLVGQEGTVIAIDQDDTALATLHRRFASEVKGGRIQIHKSRFSQLLKICEDLGIKGKIAAIAADLGVSSPQLDRGERGFSFMHDGPLDMRMDQSSATMTARDVVNSYGLEEMRTIFRDFGDEPKAHYVAKAICEYREKRAIDSTAELAKLVERSIFYSGKSRKHPATKVFQALRIYVNRELDELASLLNDGFTALKAGGRLGIISFHSLEDRLVKSKFSDLAKSPSAGLPKGIPLTQEELDRMGHAAGKIIRPFPISASEAEIARNARARSAKLRIIEKSN